MGFGVSRAVLPRQSRTSAGASAKAHGLAVKKSADFADYADSKCFLRKSEKSVELESSAHDYRPYRISVHSR